MDSRFVLLCSLRMMLPYSLPRMTAGGRAREESFGTFPRLWRLA